MTLDSCCSNEKEFRITYNIGHGKTAIISVCKACLDLHPIFSQYVIKSEPIKEIQN